MTAHETAMERLLITPVFRKGTVYGPLGSERLSYYQARAVGRYYEEGLEGGRGGAADSPQDQYLSEFARFCEDKDIVSEITDEGREKGVRLDYRLTPIVRFPAFVVKYHDREYIARESVTVCAAKSASKLWISLSQKESEEKLDVDGWKVLYDEFSEYVELRSPVLREYYCGIIKLLAEEGMMGPDGESIGKSFQIEEHLSIIIASIETDYSIEGILESGLKKDRDSILKAAREDSESWRVLEPFLSFAMKVTGVEDYDPFQFFIQTSTPMYEDGKRIVPYVVQNRESLRRMALVVSTKDMGWEHPLEFYFTIGKRDTEFDTRRYRNSDLTSRAIMTEVGRVY